MHGDNCDNIYIDVLLKCSTNTYLCSKEIREVSCE